MVVHWTELTDVSVAGYTDLYFTQVPLRDDCLLTLPCNISSHFNPESVSFPCCDLLIETLTVDVQSRAHRAMEKHTKVCRKSLYVMQRHGEVLLYCPVRGNADQREHSLSLPSMVSFRRPPGKVIFGAEIYIQMIKL